MGRPYGDSGFLWFPFPGTAVPGYRLWRAFGTGIDEHPNVDHAGLDLGLQDCDGRGRDDVRIMQSRRDETIYSTAVPGYRLWRAFGTGMDGFREH